MKRACFASVLLAVATLGGPVWGDDVASPPVLKVLPPEPAALFPLSCVRLLDSPFAKAAAADRTYLLALDPDRLLAPFRREAGLVPRKPSYGNWESGGLDGHTAGHYLSALADMIAAGHDADGQLRQRLDYMVGELAECQKQSPDGYVGGVPGSKKLWAAVAAGNLQALFAKWVPWYNLHKTFAGLRDAYLAGRNTQARDVLVRLGDWAGSVTANLSDAQMQKMLTQEQGGMNEVLAEIYAITGDAKYLALARRFCHHAVLDPLERGEDHLTGLHANTQIPKIVGLATIAALTGDKQADAGARFFWDDVTGKRSVAFGGNSVSEHFNDPKDFIGMLEHREGPETCNTYNMLRLTEALFATQPKAAYADYYERALYNHILAAIDPDHPGFVYFTPIRPGHYRVYSQPDTSFWCCVGTGMENPGRYGQFIYARAEDGVYVNLFIPSELTVADRGLVLKQETAFPNEEATRLTLHLDKASTFTLHVRYPGWVAAGAFAVKVNGEPVKLDAAPSSYATITRQWKDGDRVDVSLPMRTTVESLPDGSDWYAILHGPIVLASPDGTDQQAGLFADAGRMAHIAGGPLRPLDLMPALLTTAADLPARVVPDPAAGPMHFRLTADSEPASSGGLSLQPFYTLEESRYQMYWEVTSKEGIAARKQRLAEQEKSKIARDLATIDFVAVGEQQSEVDHDFQGDATDSGIFNGRRWRHGRSFQYTLDTHGVKDAVLSVTYNGGDTDRTFDILAGGTRIGTEVRNGDRPGEFIEKLYTIPADVMAAAPDGKVRIRFVGSNTLAGGVFDVRLMRQTPQQRPATLP